MVSSQLLLREREREFKDKNCKGGNEKPLRFHWLVWDAPASIQETCGDSYQWVALAMLTIQRQSLQAFSTEPICYNKMHRN